ncbi:MAG: hypothetical protein HOB73_16720 [Planctomycetaceae bacterium]|jgi:hypothetical protein|nr:hypothetical protein [Planctomycetaceae bacterium]
MTTFTANCKECGVEMVLPTSKQGATVNCPLCKTLQTVGRGADVAWYFGAVFGCYGTLMVGFGIGLGFGLVNGAVFLSITMGVLLLLSTIVLGIVLICS